MLRGREFSDSDRPDSLPVAVVSAAFAREVYGGEDPIGQTFGFGIKPSNKDWNIVGIVADVHMNGVREPAPPMFYVPMEQSPGDNPHFLAIRFVGPAGALQEGVKEALKRTDPGLVLTNWRTLNDRMNDDLRGDLATTRLAGIFGGCALALAGVGIAGSLGYLVVLRQRELALRIAIGASPGQLLRSVLADSVYLSALGSGLGILAIWLLPEVPAIKAVLYGRPGVASTLVAALVALVTAVMAGYLPARRAARIDPIQMLKSE
jgi:hypothetical protein